MKGMTYGPSGTTATLGWPPDCLASERATAAEIESSIMLQHVSARSSCPAAAKDAAKIDMRRQVVQGQLDMVTKMNEKAALDERDIEVTQPLAS